MTIRFSSVVSCYWPTFIMRVLIFALLALSAHAANYGQGSYYSGYPSYSYSSYPSSYYGGYGSSLYGATYGTGLGYGSGATYGSGASYGSGLGYGSGASYGSGLGYGSGITYGSSLGYGSGYGSGATYGTGYTGSYTTAYKPAVYQTARYSYRQPQSNWAERRSGYSTGGAPGKIEFILGGAGYRTGTENYRTPVLPKPAGAFTHGSTSAHRSGAVDGATGRISFTRDFSRVSGQSGFQGSRGTVGASAFRKPASVVTESDTGAHGHTDSVSQVHFQEVTDVSAGDFTGTGIVSQPEVPTRSFHDSKSGHQSGFHGTSGHQPIIFTQDFSKVTGNSAGRTPIRGFNKAPAALAPNRIPSRSAGTVGSIHKSQVHGMTAEHPRITFTQDFSKVGGQSQQIGIKPEIHSFDKTFPTTETVSKHDTSFDVGSHHKTVSHGIVDNSQIGGIDFSQDIGGVSGHHTTGPKPVAVSSGRLSTGGVSTLKRPSFGSKAAGIQSNIPAQGFSAAAGPSRITFTQDFSRVSGQLTPAVKPAISTAQKLTAPIIPGVVASREFQAVRRNTSPFENKPFRRTAAQIQSFKAPKQTVAEQFVTSIQDPSSAHGLFPVRSDAEKSIFAAGPITGLDAGVKSSNFAVAPEVGFAHDKISAFKHSTADAVAGGKLSAGHRSTVGHSQLIVPSYGVSSAVDAGDKSQIFVAVPAEDYGHDKSSVFLHSTGVAPTDGYVSEKGSILTSEEVDYGVSSQAQGYKSVSSPFKSYYSSSYPGYSHLSGESPRFDFSHDRSLLYTYNSPYLVSPFSYTYDTGNKYFDQGSVKTVA